MVYYDPHLYHSGVKDMKLYQHLFGKQQAAYKYAKGAETKGFELSEEYGKKKHFADIAKEQYQNADGENKKQARNIYVKSRIEQAKTGMKLAGTKVSGKLATAVGNALGVALSVGTKIYNGATAIKDFINNRKGSGNVLQNIGNLASRFTTMLGLKKPSRVTDLPIYTQNDTTNPAYKKR